MIQLAPPPPAVAASAPPAAYDRSVANLVAVIAHGQAAELDRLEGAAQAASFIAKHVDGPTGDELMVIFTASNQTSARDFGRDAPRRFPRLRFESALLPPLKK